MLEIVRDMGIPVIEFTLLSNLTAIRCRFFRLVRQATITRRGTVWSRKRC